MPPKRNARASAAPAAGAPGQLTDRVRGLLLPALLAACLRHAAGRASSAFLGLVSALTSRPLVFVPDRATLLRTGGVGNPQALAEHMASCIGVAAHEAGLGFGNGTHHQLHEGEVHVDCGKGTTRRVATNHNNKSRDDGGDDPPSFGMMHSMPLSDGSTHHRLGLAGVLAHGGNVKGFCGLLGAVGDPAGGLGLTNAECTAGYDTLVLLVTWYPGSMEARDAIIQAEARMRDRLRRAPRAPHVLVYYVRVVFARDLARDGLPALTRFEEATWGT